MLGGSGGGFGRKGRGKMMHVVAMRDLEKSFEGIVSRRRTSSQKSNVGGGVKTGAIREKGGAKLFGEGRGFCPIRCAR